MPPPTLNYEEPVKGVHGCLKMSHVISGLVFQCLKSGCWYSAVSGVCRLWTDGELRARFWVLGAF